MKKVNQNNLKLYGSVFKNNPEIDYIIDSSKDIIRFNEIRKKTDVFPIILIRDIKEVMKSKWVKESKNKVKGWQNYYNKHILPLLKGMNDKDFHVLSYEKFIDNPKQCIEEISTKLDINVHEFKTNIPMNNYHVVAGNGMRYTDEVKIRQKPVNLLELKQSLKKSGLSKFYLDRI